MDPAKGYPENWPEIAHEIKERAGWKCEHCGDPHSAQNILTVHHLDMDPSNCSDENLVALCQRCHLRFQGRHGKTLTRQVWLFDEPNWLRKRRAKL